MVSVFTEPNHFGAGAKKFRMLDAELEPKTFRWLELEPEI